jgi:mono/diheme cytochrome c family protein
MQRAAAGALATTVAGLFMGVTVLAQMPQQAPAGQDQGPPAKITTVKATRSPSKTVKVEVPIERAVRADTPAFRGEGWFQQHCGVCHLGRWRKSGQLQPYAPAMTGVFKDRSPEREAFVRAYIQNGSANMPGFRNTFTSTQFEELIQYLKTL